jgi:hypothetical protein
MSSLSSIDCIVDTKRLHETEQFAGGMIPPFKNIKIVASPGYTFFDMG